MTTQPLPTDVVEARLNHLIDRARRNRLLHEEADRFTTELRDLVRRMEDTEDERDRLATEVARLTAGQCTHTRAMCQTHHTTPVAGCPYPRCVAARGRDQRAPVAPAEHCGNQKPLFTKHTQRTECVLRPGHTGSHADEHGTRWWWTDADVPPPTATA